MSRNEITASEQPDAPRAIGLFTGNTGCTGNDYCGRRKPHFSYTGKFFARNGFWI